MNPDQRYKLKPRDVIVAVAVCAVVIFLLLPALTGRRGDDRRLQCQNNMRQLALGLLGFSNAKGAFPNAGTILDDPAFHQGDPRRSNIYQMFTDPQSAGHDSKILLRSWTVDILPYIDNQELYNAWNLEADYLSPAKSTFGPSNMLIAKTTIGILRCPADPTVAVGEGNQSYVVNGGFVRWPAIPVSWSGHQRDGLSSNGQTLKWTQTAADWKEVQAVGQKLGVMFLGTHTGDQPWDIKATPSSISDGASSTLLLGENTLVGYSSGDSPYSGRRPSNWACPLPNFTMFIGSDNICQSKFAVVDCLAGQLTPQSGGADGPGWANSNVVGTFENIGYGRSLTVEGSFPFVNSGHADGNNFVFCDGAVRFVKTTIDGTVYSKLITPAGGKLPANIKQGPSPSSIPDAE